MSSIEFLSETDLVDASGKLVQVTVDFDWRMRINGAPNHQVGVIESLIFLALAARSNLLVSDEEMKQALSETNEVAVIQGMNPNTLMTSGVDYKERFSRAAGNLAMRSSPLYDNIFSVTGYQSRHWLMLVRNFDDSSPENDNRKGILDSVSHEGLSDAHIEKIDRALSHEFRSKVRRAEENRKILEIKSSNTPNAQIGTSKTEPISEVVIPKKLGRKPGSKNKPKVVLVTEDSQTPKPDETQVPKKTASKTRKRANLANELAPTNPKIYANDLFKSIKDLPAGGKSCFNIDLITGYLESIGYNPKVTDIESILRVAISQRIIRPEINKHNPQQAGEVIYIRI